MRQITNPILRGFNPDPSIVRVGRDYYIATSTFEWFPGVQIHHSRDLIHWKLVHRPLEHGSQLQMRGNPPSGGVWAPCLSYDREMFYLIFTDVKHLSGAFKDTPNYLVTAPKITGPWSEPVYLNSSGFDPSLFHDEDGKKWLVNMDWDWRPGRNAFAGILLQEYDADLQRLVGPIHRIFTGSPLGVTEGPHLYRRDSYYYLLTAEGGTGHRHAVTMARSNSLTGPYEIDPENPILTSWGYEEAELKKAGHGDIVETPDGQWYMVHLCSRPVGHGTRGNEEGFSVLGRETGIQKMIWTDDGWLRKHDGKRWPSLTVPAPAGASVAAESEEEESDRFRDDFDDVRLSIPWQAPRIPLGAAHYSLTERPGYLRLRGGESPSSRFEVSLVARRQQAFSYTATTCLEFIPESYKQLAGLACVYNDRAFHYLYVTAGDDGGRVIGILSNADGREEFPIAGSEPSVPRQGAVYLRAEVDAKALQFSFAACNSRVDDALPQDVRWQTVGPVLDMTILSDEFGTGWGFTGAFVGLMCQDLAGLRREADFAWFEYVERG